MKQCIENIGVKGFLNVIDNMKEGYAFHKMLYDENGEPYDYQFIYVNDAFLKIVNKKKEDFEGRNATEVLPWVQGNKNNRAIREYGRLSMTGGVIERKEQFLDNYLKWVDIKAISSGDQFFSTIIRDITVEKELERDLKYDEERYRTMLETVPVSILEADITEMWHMITEAKMKHSNIKDFLASHPEVIQQLQGFMLVKAVNNEAVRLFNADSQRELIKNIHKVTTKETNTSWKRFFKDLWHDRDLIETEAVFQDLQENKMILFLRMKKIITREKVILLISIMNVSHLKQMEAEWEKQQTELYANYEQMEAYNEELRATQEDLSEINAELSRTNSRLVKREEQLKIALQSAKEALWILDERTGDFEDIGDWESLLGYETGELGRSFETWLHYIHKDDRERVKTVLQQAFYEEDSFFEIEYRFKNKEGNWVWVLSKGRVTRDSDDHSKKILGTHQDITRRKEAEQRLSYLTAYDNLTGLPNMTYLNERLTEEIERARRSKKNIAVLTLDLDGFKKINDSMGHNAGDALLVMVASRLRKRIRRSDFIARVSSDEFALIFPEIDQRANISKLADNVLGKFSRPFKVEQNEVFLKSSIGIATFPDDGNNVDSLIKKSELALLRAKQKGKNQFKFYTETMNTKAVKRFNLETRLHRAIEKEQFVLNYQPQFNLKTSKLVGIESLIRWEDPDRGTISPGDFIPIAEESGLIVPIGNWVLKEACGQLKSWHNMGFYPLTISVNLSPLQFSQDDLVDIVRGVIDDSGIDPSDLMLEITENLLMEDQKEAYEKLKALKDMGCKLSIDDFGTGYSSLAYLRKFPIDELKIDKSFVLDLEFPDNASIVKTIISLAENLNLNVIAEGIEQESQKDFLMTNKCNLMQGFLFGHPMKKEDLETYLTEFFGTLKVKE